MRDILKEIYSKAAKLYIYPTVLPSVLLILNELYNKENNVEEEETNFCDVVLNILNVPKDIEDLNKYTLLIYEDLVYKELIQRDEQFNYSLTIIGRDFIDTINKLMPLKKTTAKKQVEEYLLDVLLWVDDYQNLWPTKAPVGYYLKAHRDTIAKKMAHFILIYGYDKDTIFEATKLYLKDRAKVANEFIRKISNFILFSDNMGVRTVNSDLANWCAHYQDTKGKSAEEIVKEQEKEEFIFNDMI